MLVVSSLFLHALLLTKGRAQSIRGGETQQQCEKDNEAMCPTDPAGMGTDVDTFDFSPAPARFLDALSGWGEAWLVHGEFLVEENIPLNFPDSMGVIGITVVSDRLVKGHYSLANEIDFELYRREKDTDATGAADTDGMTDTDATGAANRDAGTEEDDVEWLVKVVGMTAVSGMAADLVAEMKIRDLFLRDGLILRTHYEYLKGGANTFPRIFVSTGTGDKTSSVALLPLPFAVSKLQGSDIVSGEWAATIDGLHMGLRITKTGARSLSCVLRGVNSHRFSVSQISETEIAVGAISSTQLTPENVTLAEIEDDVLHTIGCTTTASVSQGDIEDGNQRYTPPSITFQCRDGRSIRFMRDLSVDREYQPFGIVHPTIWQWVPESIRLASPEQEALKPLAENTQTPVIMVLRQFATATMLDVFIDGRSHLKAGQIPTVTRRFLKTILRMVEVPSDLEQITQAFEAFITQFEFVESYDRSDFIALIGPNASLFFQAMTLPALGSWVLDSKLSQVSGGHPDMAAFPSRRVTLDVMADGSGFRCLIHGTANILTFSLTNENVAKGRTDWDLTPLAARVVNESSGADANLEAFFTGGVVARFVTYSDIKAVEVSGPLGTLVFLRPADLTKALSGDWKLVSGAVSDQRIEIEVDGGDTVLQFNPAGLGQMAGYLLLGYDRYSVRLFESLEGESDLRESENQAPQTLSALVPPSWDIDLRKIVSFPLKTGTSNHGNAEAILQALSKTVAIEVASNAMSLKINSSNSLLHFVRVLDRKAHNRLQGIWDVEFVILSDPAYDLKEFGDSMVAMGSAPLRLEIAESNSSELPLNSSENGDEEFWERDSLSFFHVLAHDVNTNKPIAEFTLKANAFASVRIAGWRDTAESAQLSARSQQLKRLLSLFCNSSAEAPLLMEVTLSDLIISDGSSMLGLSRVPFYSSFIGIDIENIVDGAPPSVIVQSMKYSQEKNDSISAPAAILIMQRMRRRLEAVEKLDQVLLNRATSEAHRV